MTLHETGATPDGEVRGHVVVRLAATPGVCLSTYWMPMGLFVVHSEFRVHYYAATAARIGAYVRWDVKCHFGFTRQQTS